MLHSNFGASSMAIVMGCAGAYHAQLELPDSTNPAAEEGTGAHMASEFSMAMGVDLGEMVGMVFNGITVTEDMITYLEIYVGEVTRILKMHPDAVFMLEKRVTMSSVAEDVFGTGDCMIYVPSARTLYNIDLKYGYNVVDVNQNVQLAHYGVAALDTFGLWTEVDVVEGVIVQPRKETIDGVVRRERQTVHDMLRWQKTFANQIAIARDPNAPRTAGEWCTYCKARATCRKRLERTFSLVGLDASLEQLDTEELIALYNESKTIKSHLDAVAEEVIRRGRAGENFHHHGLKMVKAIARHSCEKPDELATKIKASHPDITDAMLFNQKVKSKTDLKKIKDAEGNKIDPKLIDGFFTAPPTSLTVAPMHDKRISQGRGAALGLFSPVTKTVN